MKQRPSEQTKREKRIHRWSRFVLVVKWLLEHRVLQDLIAFIIWLVDKLLTN